MPLNAIKKLEILQESKCVIAIPTSREKQSLEIVTQPTGGFQ